jgi:hypothetical protein
MSVVCRPVSQQVHLLPGNCDPCSLVKRTSVSCACTAFIERGEDLAHLPVHVGDLGEVFGEVLPRLRRVGDVGRQFEAGFGGYFDASPMTQGTCGSVKATTRQKGCALSRVMKLFTPGEVVRIRGITHGIGIEAGHVFKR